MREYINMTTGEVITRPNKIKAFIYFYRDSKKYKYRVRWCDVKHLKEGNFNYEA